jgi:hypothetical protein
VRGEEARVQANKSRRERRRNSQESQNLSAREVLPVSATARAEPQSPILATKWPGEGSVIKML